MLRQSISILLMDEVSSSQHHILLLLLISLFEKRHCRCKHSLKLAQRIFKNFKKLLKSRILTNFTTESHEFSNYAMQPHIKSEATS